MNNRLRVLVSGEVAGAGRQGGAVWAVLQYVLGLRALGHDVHLVEQLPEGRALNDPGPLSAAFASISREFALQGSYALVGDEERTLGLPYDRLVEWVASADLLINISGSLRDPRLLERVDHRLYLDVDPGFTQLWQRDGIDVRLGGHTRYATVGLNVGNAGCDLPTLGIHWLKTRPPVVLDVWNRSEQKARFGFTTVANWRSYGSIFTKGTLYGQKVHSIRPFYAVPTLTSESLQLALTIHAAEVNDLRELRSNRWIVFDAHNVAGTPGSYRQFIQGSQGELGFAKSGYVLSACGWFSDRSACYLASGRPVLAQDTGLRSHFRIGEGLLTFTNTGELIAGIETIAGNYERQARAARELAEAYFNSETVLTNLLSAALAHG